MEPNNAVSSTLSNGAGCHSKYSNNISISSQSCGYFNKVEGPNLKCESGNSGGPVYGLDGKAFGIVSSASFNGPNVGQCDNITVSLIDYAVRDLGFVIKTEF